MKIFKWREEYYSNHGLEYSEPNSIALSKYDNTYSLEWGKDAAFILINKRQMQDLSEWLKECSKEMIDDHRISSKNNTRRSRPRRKRNLDKGEK